ncbi:hypothetical protein [Dactylosporangium matsuzakiense]|uniref:Secreted protein n=1 Tax=Dactylosporangium matsuzakiense TaxID=53360 RepID=A0A9W6KEJ6_9ACTN|nr:hypothetical protein [Dactylosporangium matsuzakiense]UWZ44390.1 hypothetical protein Dmats_44695 [Dactylosporangium matsuzakiense]GLK99451.1 hypothetical protein GCM10017581_011920 [Dactylosporangium matsuzakiense]
MVLKGPFVAAGLVAALLLGFGIARATAPAATPAASDPTTIPSHSHGGATLGDLGGFSLSAGGFTLAPAAPPTFEAGVQRPFAFRILGVDGKAVTKFIPTHDKLLHFIVVKHDLSGFQHLHPEMAADGTWSIPLTLPSPGIWRLYTDFVTPDPATGQQVPLALSIDATVAGAYTPLALAPAARTAEADGFTVTYEGTVKANATQPLTFRVFFGGSPVTDLEKYLAAYGHLVVIRDGDLGYLHVHPEDQLVGGAVKFWLSAPSPGRYRMFFEFQKGGAVHRAEFTVDVQ